MNLAIIGGGLSGTLLAHYLLQAERPINILLFEKDIQQLSRGIAYRASLEGQLLNVPAGRMNIFGLEDGFYEWLLKNSNPKIEREDFVARSLFGSYLKEVFEKSVRESKHVTLQVINDEVVDIIKQSDTLQVMTATKKIYRVDQAVVANGILPAQDPLAVTEEVKHSGLYQSNPWSFQYQNQIKSDYHVVLIGAGLTMLDHAVNLLKNKRGLKISAFSRRGLLPLAHAPYRPYDFPEYMIAPREDIGELLRTIRHYYKAHQSKGLDWRTLIDKIRTQVPELWKVLSPVSKARFLRHLKPYWEIHRHRALPAVLSFIEQAKRQNRFSLIKGRLQEVKIDGERLNVIISNPSKTTTIQAHYLLNSSGLQQNISLTSDILLNNLMDRGFMIPDIHGLGVETDDSGVLKNNQEDKRIFVLGALRRASVFESTAAKEIGEQAYVLSKTLLS